MAQPYYRSDLALVHHRGFGQHAAMCAPGIVALLEPVLRRNGRVVELGCGTGLLTRHLVEAGHRVLATDASPAMLHLAAAHVPAGVEIERLTLPDDAIPAADAIVAVGHVLSYLPDEAAIWRAIAKMADALAPGGVLAFDICDLEWGTARVGAANHARVGDDWAIITEYTMPEPHLFVRNHTAFVREAAGTWRRDDETHHNVLIDTDLVPGRLAERGVTARVTTAFGAETLPRGLRVVIGERPA